MSAPLVLAVHSLPAYGGAGLKCVLQVLGARVLAVPSLLLTGLGNVPGHQRFGYDFEANLRGSLHHVADNNHSVVVLIGYLADATQIEEISSVLEDFREIITAIVVDPICGDNGKPYVDAEIIASWPGLLERANWATPNRTEVLLLTGESDLDQGIEQLRERFPTTNWIITSYPLTNGIGNRLIDATTDEIVRSDRIPRAISGAGDLFTSLFIQYHFLQGYTPRMAVLGSAQEVYRQLSFQPPSLP